MTTEEKEAMKKGLVGKIYVVGGNRIPIDHELANFIVREAERMETETKAKEAEVDKRIAERRKGTEDAYYAANPWAKLPEYQEGK